MVWGDRFTLVYSETHVEVFLPLVDAPVTRGQRHSRIVRYRSLLVSVQLKLVLGVAPELGSDPQLIKSVLVVSFEEFWGCLQHSKLFVTLDSKFVSSQLVRQFYFDAAGLRSYHAGALH